MSRYGYEWPEYVTVAERRARAKRTVNKLRRKGLKIDPVEITGRRIAGSFWGKAWCRQLESFSDYENRLPRGRSYVRHGAVCHLEIKKGKILAKVAGNAVYNVVVKVDKLPDATWKRLKQQCAGEIGSLLELLQGKLSDSVMKVVTDPHHGLLPLADEIHFQCSCPDWADMCKHVAATLYGVGNRLDRSPELLFTLRGVDPAELLDADLDFVADVQDTGIADDDLAEIFGVEIDPGGMEPPAPKAPGKKEDSSFPVDASGLTIFTGQAIRKLRKKLGLSQEDLAGHIHVTLATVKRWEKMRKPIKLRLRSRIELETLLKFGVE